jgi:hypothetical protein
MENESAGKPNVQKRSSRPEFRVAITVGVFVLFAVLVIVYTVGVVFGYVGETSRIDAVNLAMIAALVFCGILLLIPESFERLKLFEMAGMKLEMRERVRQVERALSAQDRRIEQLIQTAMSPVIFQHLCGIAFRKEYLYQNLSYFQREIYYLRTYPRTPAVRNATMAN